MLTPNITQQCSPPLDRFRPENVIILDDPRSDDVLSTLDRLSRICKKKGAAAAPFLSISRKKSPPLPPPSWPRLTLYSTHRIFRFLHQHARGNGFSRGEEQRSRFVVEGCRGRKSSNNLKYVVAFHTPLHSTSMQRLAILPPKRQSGQRQWKLLQHRFPFRLFANDLQTFHASASRAS